jgi:hypothetical protein
MFDWNVFDWNVIFGSVLSVGSTLYLCWIYCLERVWKNYGLACGMGGKAVNALFELWPIRLGSIVFVERDRD